MKKLTTIILTLNDESRIADCIDSVSFSDEIVVIDGGSTDRTVEIANHIGAKAFLDKNTSFAQKRNTGREKANGEWLLYVDSDERISLELKDAIMGVLRRKENAFVAYKLKRKNFYLGNNEWPYQEEIFRLFRKDCHLRWSGVLHETAKVTGEVGLLDGYVLHYTHRNLTDMVTKTNIWSDTEAQLRLSTNHPQMTWWRFPRVMLAAFYDSYVRQKGYKAGTMGLIESMYQAFSIFITYAKLWEKQNSSKQLEGSSKEES